MYHERNIGFVDTHPECVRRDHDLAPIVYEIVLIGNAFLVGKSCVVSRRRKSPGFKEFADGLHVFSLRAVYYAGLPPALCKGLQELPLFAVGVYHGE